MPLTTAEKTEIASRSVTPTLWKPGMVTPPAGARVVDQIGKRVLVSGKSGLRLGKPPVCLVGGQVVGTHDVSAGWRAYKDNGWSDDHISWSPGDGEVWAHGVYAKNAADVWCPPKSPDTRKKFPRLRLNTFHCHSVFVPDDEAEDDARLGATREDGLVEQAWVFNSDRPGKGNSAAPTVYFFRRMLIHVGCLPDARSRRDTCQAGYSCYQLLKQGSPRSAFHWENCVIRIDSRPGIGDGDLWTPGSTFKDCVLIWRGPGQYPGKLPPDGLLVTDDLSLWDRCVGLWHDRHDLDARPDGDGPVLPPPDEEEPPVPQGFPPVKLDSRNVTATRRVVIPDKPDDAEWCHISVEADDPDGAAEAEAVLLPGTEWAHRITLFGPAVAGAGFNKKRAVVRMTVPASAVRPGEQEVVFTWLESGGCTIHGLSFEWAAEDAPDGPDDEPDDGDGEPPAPDEVIAGLKAEIKELREELAELRRYVETVERHVSTLEQDLDAKEAKIEDLEHRIHQATRALAGEL
jgi:hypothetical protein